MAAAEAALRRVRRDPRGRLLEDDEDAASKAPRADPHARQRRPEVPGGRRPRGRDSVRRARARARTRLQRDLDRNETALLTVRQELATRDDGLTEVRILDLLISSVEA